MNKLIALLPLVFASAIVWGQDLTTEEYIEKYQVLAIEEMHRSGVPAAITLAQGILESGSGNSDLVKKSNNHFGIKCKTGWTGASVRKDDDRKNECFRAYKNATQSYRDHSNFLRNSARYSFLFNLEPDDYRSWAAGLKRAGYATDPKYASRLIGFIEKYNLNQYTLVALHGENSDDIAGRARIIYGEDAGTKSNREANNGNTKKDWIVARYPVSEIRQQNTNKQSGQKNNNIDIRADNKALSSSFSVIRVNNLKVVRAAAGTSLLGIATRFKVRLSRLLEWNELAEDGILNTSQNIFLEKKRQSGSQESIVINHELSVYEIAQEYGIQSDFICDYNGFGKSDVLPSGTKIYLQPRQQSIAIKDF